MSRLLPGILLALMVLFIAGIMFALNPALIDQLWHRYHQNNSAQPQNVGFVRGNLTLRGHNGNHVLSVEIAGTPSQRQYGLMYRSSLPENAGMLFLFGSPRVVEMWMLNMDIPLDIIFVDEKGRIVRAYENIPADSEKTYGSQVPVVAAIEMNAGAFSKMGMTEGDSVDLAPFAGALRDLPKSEPPKDFNLQSLPKEIRN
ncbi:MAG: DUF192 domain-containing protein [Alphaproteobacteria bacterium]|nr:DUF192 domain-containing protein [Alphaproteobacteria bacterium]